MMTSPLSHRSAASLSHTASSTSLSPSIANLNALASPQQRRMTTSSLPPPSSLNLPEPVYGHPSPTASRRPPSPLRNEFKPELSISDDEDVTNDDQGNHDHTWGRTPHASASVTQLATSLAQRVNSLISPTTPSQPLPSDAELEAEAEMERDRSRREAEMILTREAEERKAMEEKVLAMMQTTRSSPPSVQPPSRSPNRSTPPSPATSQKEGGTGWWAAAKSRLTPTKDKDKESLTPAQKIVHETKTREKNNKRLSKNKDTSTASEISVPKEGNDSVSSTLAPPSGSFPRSPISGQSSPTPSGSQPTWSPMNNATTPINLSPSSLRLLEGGGSSPSREATPLYANFTPQGTLDVPGTLLVIAKRFEKLERWTVSHVRALEERMSDVERWLVDKENEKEAQQEIAKQKAEVGDHQPSPSFSHSLESQPHASAQVAATDLLSIKEDVTELQSRVGELGREVAKLVAAPATLSSAPLRSSPIISSAPQVSSLANSHSTATTYYTDANTLSTPRIPSSTVRDSTSPPLARSGMVRTPSLSRTRLPYPTGDYTSPPDAIPNTFSPPSSPPSAARVQQKPPPNVSARATSPNQQMALPRSTSPESVVPDYLSSLISVRSDTSQSVLPNPKTTQVRRGSVSPTPLPRKRYTVALGGPIVAPPDEDMTVCADEQTDIGTAFFSSAPLSVSKDTDTSAISHDAVPLDSGERARAQSTFGSPPTASLQSNQSADSHRMSLKPRIRSLSTDQSRIRLPDTPSTPLPSTFVDPLVLRRQEKNVKGRSSQKSLAAAGKKVPIGQLVAFFDGEKT